VREEGSVSHLKNLIEVEKSGHFEEEKGKRRERKQTEDLTPSILFLILSARLVIMQGRGGKRGDAAELDDGERERDSSEGKGIIQ